MVTPQAGQELLLFLEKFIVYTRRSRNAVYFMDNGTSSANGLITENV